MSPLELLLRVQSRDSTGQLFVVTYDGRQIRVGVEAGKIVHVGYGPRRGKAAAELASNAVAKSATFRADPDVMRDEDLPNERVLLGLLSRMLSGSNADALSSVLSGDVFEPETLQTGNPVSTLPPQVEGGKMGEPPRTRPSLETRNMVRAASNIPAAQISRVKAILTEYVGPMSGLLVEEKLAGGVANLDALVERLAPEIGNAKDAQKFREAVDKLK
ncbi:MAG TPA: hypothetical protein VGY49_12795 [Burkholderiaceae bacterium]|jgi:hypothetical protein|nr:hypothetical protein [Burkholderiaceae bacterium]